MLNALPFAISFVFFPLALLGAWYGGFWILAAPIYAFIAIPASDIAMKINEAHLPPDTDEKTLIWHRVLTSAWLPVQLVMIYGLIWIATKTDRLTTLETGAMAICVGIAAGGIGITYAHEMIHQRNKFERAIGELLMCSSLYGHWCTEHVYGHHINVATPSDPATARESENIYQFLPRVLIGTVTSAWNIQLSQLQKRKVSFWSKHNAFLRYGLFTVLFIGAAVTIGGWMGLSILLIQAVVAILLLELVDYVEHYGLLRRRRENGSFEPTQPHHSWNSGHQASNWLLANLQRHSDHHFNPSRRFPLLQSLPESEAPQLPFGYPWMVILALVPPMFSKVMTPRLRAWQSQFYPEETSR